ncbi:MAG: PDDEXK nuclease domain-containing protein [bacterium]
MKKKFQPLRKSNIPAIKEYTETLVALKERIQEAQTKAMLSANKEFIKLYWLIGQTIVEKQETCNWGSNVIEKLAMDLQAEFPGVGGFSRANIFYMRAFYMAYEKVQRAVGLFEKLPFISIPWGHNVTLITKLKDNNTRLWYAQKAIENGWSRTVLELQIESKLHARTGKGFSFVGRQYHIQIGSQDFYIDLLFYHFKLRCFVVVELKSGGFDPHDAGQLNFYLSAIDNTLKSPEDKPTIGLLLCKSKDNLVAEYALQNIHKPVGITGYKASLLKNLPKDLKSSFPTVQEIEAELEKHTILNKKITKKKKQTKKQKITTQKLKSQNKSGKIKKPIK